MSYQVYVSLNLHSSCRLKCAKCSWEGVLKDCKRKVRAKAAREYFASSDNFHCPSCLEVLATRNSFVSNNKTCH